MFWFAVKVLLIEIVCRLIVTVSNWLFCTQTHYMVAAAI